MVEPEIQHGAIIRTGIAIKIINQSRATRDKGLCFLCSRCG